MTESVLITLLIKYKYEILFPGLVIEGPILTLLAGFLATPAGGSIFNLATLYFVVLFSDVFGDVLYYSVGRWGRGTKLFKWLLYRMKRTEESFIFVEEYFRDHGGKTLALAKITHGLGWPVMVASGSARMKFGRFFAFCFATSIFKSAGLILLGYFYGRSYELVDDYLSYTSFIITSVVILILVIYIVRSWRKSKK